MIVKCKNPNCGALINTGVHQASRVQCKTCKLIFINDKFPLQNSKYGTKYPECFTNYDSTNDICKNRCDWFLKCKKLSPPSDSDYFNPENEHKIDKNKNKEVLCPNCGSFVIGNFCNNCGSELTGKTIEPNFYRSLASEKFNGWSKYFNTVYKLLYYPDDFFGGAFSSHCKKYFFEAKTLAPEKFYLVDFTVLSLFQLIVYFCISGKLELENEFLVLLDTIINIIILHVPAFLFYIFLKRDLGRWEKKRQKNLIHVGILNFGELLPVIIYSFWITMLGLPFFLMCFYIIQGNALNHLGAKLITAGAFALISQYIALFHFFPIALHYRYRIPVKIARSATWSAYTFPIIIYTIIKKIIALP